MARRKYAPSLDKNHKVIVKYLRNHGVNVIELLHPLDLLIFFRGFIAFGEIKDTTDNAHYYTAEQIRFISETPFPVIFLTGEEQSLAAIKGCQIVSESQKRALAGLLLRNLKSMYTAKDVRDVL